MTINIRLLSVVETTSAMMLLNGDGEVCAISQPAADVLGMAPMELLGRGVDELAPPFGRCWRGRVSDGSVVVVRPDRNVAIIRCDYVPVGLDGDGALLVLRDLTDESAQASHAAYASQYDSSTRLPNLNRATLHLAWLLDSRRNALLVSIAVERYATVRALVGSRAAEELMRIVAERVSQVCTGLDLLARINDDELLFIVEGLFEDEDSLDIAQQMVDTVGSDLELNAARLALDIRCGTVITGSNASAGELIDNARAARLWAASGGLSYSRFDHVVSAAKQRELELETRLRQAVAGRRLQLALQPICRCADRTLAAYEGLSRWHDDALGDVGPEEFIGVAERCGLIGQITDQMMTRALDVLERHRDRVALVPIAINLSTLQLLDPRLPDRIVSAVAERELDGLLWVEITEGSLVETGAHATLHRLHELGVHIAVDDFGVGYSSLAYLSRLPVDSLKIDRSLVSDLGSQRGRTLVQGIIAVAQQLGLTVTAEGVEEDDQLQFLTDHGCDFVQGWLVGRPEIDAE